MVAKSCNNTKSAGAMIMNIRDNKGYVLVTSLLMLLVLTVIGMAAISTSTLDNLLSGNIRLRESNQAKADGCSEVSLMVIERAVRNEDLRGFATLVKDPNLTLELRSESFKADTLTTASADVECIGDTNAVVDIDMMYPRWIGGTSIEFASGYEGLGKSGGAGFSTYYRVNASGSEALMNSMTNVGAIYRFVP
jgi:Tfp pilus assembly protein PilX